MANVSTRGGWLRLVKDAGGVSDLKEAVLMLEETLRGLQEGEDKMEGGRMGESRLFFFFSFFKYQCLGGFDHGLGYTRLRVFLLS